METQQCLSDQELSRFDLGDLSAEKYEQVSGHLEQCSDCASRFDALILQEDPVVARLRLPLPADALADDAELQELAEQTVARMDTANLVADNTSVGIRGTSPDLQAMVAEILKPAETSEEL